MGSEEDLGYSKGRERRRSWLGIHQLSVSKVFLEGVWNQGRKDIYRAWRAAQGSRDDRNWQLLSMWKSKLNSFTRSVHSFSNQFGDHIKDPSVSAGLLAFQQRMSIKYWVGFFVFTLPFFISLLLKISLKPLKPRPISIKKKRVHLKYNYSSDRVKSREVKQTTIGTHGLHSFIWQISRERRVYEGTENSPLWLFTGGQEADSSMCTAWLVNGHLLEGW